MKINVKKALTLSYRLRRRVVIFVLAGIGVFSICCQEEFTNLSQVEPNGESLARIYCASCHQYPDPNLLDKKSWENYILPRMGNMLGIYSTKLSRAELIKPDIEVLSEIYPEEAIIDSSKWNAIYNFYIKKAASNLIDTNFQCKNEETLTLFEPKFPNIKLSPPSTTLLQFGASDELFLGDAHSKRFLN